LIAEGSRDTVDAFLTAISDRMAAYISTHSCQWSSGSRHHSTFRIGH
jgi:hypothetical protein